MKQNAKSDKPFTLNSHVLERLKPGKTWFLGVRLRSNGGLSFMVKGKEGKKAIFMKNYSLLINDIHYFQTKKSFFGLR